MSVAETLTRLVKTIGIFIETVLGLSIILRLLGALPTFIVFEWVYKLSDPFRKPFSDTFSPIMLGNRFMIDISGIFAMFAYFIITSILILIISKAFETHPRK